MMTATKKLILLTIAGMVGLLGWVSSADALLTCEAPHQAAGTAWCDEDATRYLQDTLCIVEPVDDTGSIDEEVIGGGVCILGKFKTPADLERLVDFVVSYEFPADPLLGPMGLFVPELETLAETGEFMTTVPLDDEGIFDVSVQTRVLGSDGSFFDIDVLRRVLRVAQPHLTVPRARIGGTNVDCSVADPSCFGVTELSGDSDGDGICDGPDPIPGLCSAGPDPVDDNGAEGAPHAVQVTPATAKASSVELCINSHDEESSDAGTSIVVRAVNTITDGSFTPSHESIIEASCVGVGEDLCEQLPATDAFCPGGFSVRVPLGHGSNQIDLFVSNLVTGYDMGAAERVTVTPFDVDLRGPALCVRYLDEAGNEIADVDNRALLASEAESVLVDLTLGACGADPEAIEADVPAGCDKEDPPACDTSRVCFQKNGESDEAGPKFVSLCPANIGGKTHYQARFAEPRFPINTATFRVLDAIGNETRETHSFGYGQIRPFFDAAGRLDLRNAIVPNGLGGWVPEEFVQNEIKPVILGALKSEKFKNDLFPKLLDPRQPGEEEISCLKSIESEVGCSMDHLASDERVVTFKMFCDDGCINNIGSIEIPSIYFLNQDRLRVQARIKGLHGRAEMYTMRFIDSDDDSTVDTEDDDADNDGICDRFVGAVGDCTDADHNGVCDEEKGIFGSTGDGLNADKKCILDKSISKRNCPDIDAGDEHYWGCSDRDDDNDGVSDDHDLPGRIIPDPDFGTHILPLQLLVKELVLNLDVQFVKDADGRMHVNIDNAPGRGMVEAMSDGGNLLDFDCDKDVSEIYQGGSAEDEGNGRNLWIDTEACEGLKSLSNGLNKNGGALQTVMLYLSDFMIHSEKRQNEGTNQQLVCTLEAMARCSIPKRLEATLNELEDRKFMATSMELFDNRFHLDMFAPLGLADIKVNPRGLGFKGGGVILPAGISDPDDTAERDAVEFMNALPSEMKGRKVGPLSRADDGVDPIDPISAAFEMGSEINLAVNEEMVNSIMSSVSFLVWDLANREGDDHQTLDVDATRLREDFDMGIPERGDPDGICRDKNGEAVDNAANKGFDTYKCFPFVLDALQIFGEQLNYIDFNGDGVIDPNRDPRVPLMLRASLNPLAPPTVRISSATPIELPGDDGSSRPAMVMVELEVGMGTAPISVFEEKVQDWGSEVIRSTGEIKDWCDGDRFPGMNPQKCTEGRKLPIAVFNSSGRIFVTLLLSIRDDGIVRVEGGLSSKEGESGIVLDTEKTSFKVSILENNTIVPDQDLQNIFQQNVDNILGQYLFGTVRDIRMKVPAQVPLKAFCDRYREDTPDLCECVDNPEGEDCEDDIGKMIEDIWDDLGVDEFGVDGLTLGQMLLGVTPNDLGPIHYLTVGTGVTFDLGD